MTITAKIISDSISIANVRLSTLELRYPRLAHSEFLTHRILSRNAASTRAIPTKKLADMVLADMVYPIRWGVNQAGMQAKDTNLTEEQQLKAVEIWEKMAKVCVEGCKELTDLGLHKQWAGRPLEPFQYITTLVTATEWDNFFVLRDHPDAQPEIQELAIQIRAAMNNSTPTFLSKDEWHLPYIREEEKMLSSEMLLKVSSARCARVSYLTHDGNSPDWTKDKALYDRLVASEPRHYSPLEHQATPLDDENTWSGNFRGWKQYRKLHETMSS